MSISPMCKCGNPCAYYGVVRGFSVKCLQCNAKHAAWLRSNRAARKNVGYVGQRGGLNFVDITGARFGTLVVLKRGANQKQGSGRWECACDCGKKCIVRASLLRSGAQSSCGCLARAIDIARKTKHGKRHTPEYHSWAGMIQRCHNPNSHAYKKYYGSRGISVCSRWRTSFEQFFEDMGNRPSAEHSLDRIDVNGNYEPENCRWATASQQSANRRPWKKGARV